ncbi:MAG: hypothetical protein ACM3ZF_01965 [Mycobacterium leprae]
MGRPLVAIVGSVDPTRSYDPPLRHPDVAAAAAGALGRELAGQGCDIVVYPSDPRFV